jgi:hypothetical protein
MGHWMYLLEGVPFLPVWGWGLVSGWRQCGHAILARACQDAVYSFYALTFLRHRRRTRRENQRSKYPLATCFFELSTKRLIRRLYRSTGWLSERSLVYLTVTNEFTLVDTVMMMTFFARAARHWYSFEGLCRICMSRSAAPENGNEEADRASSCTTFSK